MEYRGFGRTGLRVSALGFGCGDVGGLIVRGSPAERERGVARALELGITYFDTAPSYGNGKSEAHLGQTLKALGAEVQVGTKFRIAATDVGDIAQTITRSLDASLTRLGLERIDLLQCHNRIVDTTDGQGLTVSRFVDEVVPALAKLRDAGKIRFWGITALGETAALHRVLESGTLDTAQVCLNLLNPSAALDVPSRFPAQDFGRVLDVTRRRGIGAIVIRALAAGALSGTTDRHPVAARDVAPIASGPDYTADVRRARTFRALVDEGYVGSLVEASIRFALAQTAVSTVLVGMSSLEHIETAAALVGRGPLTAPALERCASLWQDLADGRAAG